MSMHLVIVESPTKAKTIGKFLGKDYVIKASMGHVVDLPKSTLAVDVDHDFKPDFQVVTDKKKIIAELKAVAKGAKEIILATDPDREGEAIAYHVAETLKLPVNKRKRMVFHEITKEAIEDALKNPREIDTHLVDAQTARRVLDRLVGYKLSPLLWQKVRRGLSAGRVQSVALRLIVEREKEIEKFAKNPYYTIHAVVKKEQEVTFDLLEISSQKIESQETFTLYDGEYKVSKTSIGKEAGAKEIIADLQGKQGVVADVIQKEMRRSPQAPYTTSTLQQDASRRLGLNGKRVMSIAQKLYEEGYITYHRTDSVAIAASAQTAIRSYVAKEYGDKYLPEKPRFYASKQKLAQEAHEAIRPTAVGQISNHKSQISNLVGEIGWRLYELIWKRAVASQMADAVTESTTVMMDIEKYRFKANGSVLVFDGFLKVNPFGLQDNRLPQFTVGDSLQLQNIFDTFHETSAPPRYNDASLIKTLEEKGIGRPSTYATIVSTIESRLYIERNEGRFTPTAVGNAVTEFLVTNFADIDDIPFTAEMEDSLDAIANDKKDWVPMIRAFYKPFEKKLGEVKDTARVKIEVEELNEACPQCGEPLVIRTGRFGKFISCGTFPTCKFSKPYLEDTGVLCPKDGGKVIARKTKKGRKFFGCANYPACDYATWKIDSSQRVEPGRISK